MGAIGRSFEYMAETIRLSHVRLHKCDGKSCRRRKRGATDYLDFQVSKAGVEPVQEAWGRVLLCASLFNNNTGCVWRGAEPAEGAHHGREAGGFQISI